MHNVFVFDDIISKEQQDLIEKTIFSPETQWTFGRTVFYHTHPEVTKEVQSKVMSFTKSLCRIDDDFEVDDLELYLSPIQAASNIVGQPIQKVMTSRIQLQTPINTPATCGTAHVDGYRPFPYMVGVYYVNESEGDTVLYKETIQDTTPDEIKNGKLTVDQVISPKKGRLIIFGGNIYHAAGRPKEDIRCVINYNFV